MSDVTSLRTSEFYQREFGVGVVEDPGGGGICSDKRYIYRVYDNGNEIFKPRSARKSFVHGKKRDDENVATTKKIVEMLQSKFDFSFSIIIQDLSEVDLAAKQRNKEPVYGKELLEIQKSYKKVYPLYDKMKRYIDPQTTVEKQTQIMAEISAPFKKILANALWEKDPYVCIANKVRELKYF